VLVGEIANDAPQWGRQPLDQSWRGENAIILRRLRMFEHVDDLEVVLPLQLLVADAPQVGDRNLGFRGLAGDVELEDVL
jgi:hypothetical protein